ncbi:MAG: proline dehydrogenase [Prolixibacteraceae bacterium]|jgi:proline dehydrogenase|nr:proline dehydrogenase [Prolixibacteraceae bacterium]MBT6766073.1 proline dehydrogenase [Prolixibacteraceae bacterium]MBT6999280.1 proline dehydrogenase [Prolixibacteraceae bacterium]MBT7396373.1 proline dehydrogenase [Prolixibacteraceae bacterium]
MLNKLIANILPFMPKKLIWVFSKRYIAGETIEEALLASKLLNEQNIEVTIDLLGEFIESLEEAEENKNQYLEIIERFTSDSVKGNFSLKPTMFGLLIDKEVCYNYIRQIVELAAKKHSFVRIDMEDSQCVDMELEMFEKLRHDFPKNVGLVLQSYLRRTHSDLKKLSDLNSEINPINFRLCKGIYIEPQNIAFTDYDEVRAHFLEDLEFMFKNKMYVGIATHDKFLIENSYRLIEKYEVPKNRYEFQMLYGVTPELRQSIIDKGHLMRVYVPFGNHWFNYSTRRLKENPKMANHIIKALFIRG